MYILGISNGYVATATLLKDGSVIASASEERFNGIKNYNGFPKYAIEWCLRFAGISSVDLDLVTTPYLKRPPLNISAEQRTASPSLAFLAELSKAVWALRTGFRKIRYFFPFMRPFGMVFYRMAQASIGVYYTVQYKKYSSHFLGIPQTKIIAFDHHLSHAAAAYYASPFNTKKALVLTLDAEGDGYCASVNIFDGEKVRVVSKTPREYSLGYIYGAVTEFLGMKPHEHEYKVMGLAPYAKKEDIERVYKTIEHVIDLDPHNPLQFVMRFNAQDFLHYMDMYCKRVRFDHVAGAFQRLVEEKTVEWVKAAIKHTGITTVILSGGVFMNVKANERIAALAQVKELFILPSCADESAPLGSSYLGYRTRMKQQDKELDIQPIHNIYWGSQVDRRELVSWAAKMKRSKKYTISKLREPEKTIGKMLAEHKIVARVAGRMEFGARALGNRSILAHPSDPNVVRQINTMVKNRDFWMPFATSILWERQKDYLINPKNMLSPYMMLSFHTTVRAQRELIAGLHPYDFTSRPQMVQRDMNVRYYQILKEFERLTGIGGILNTSFNLHGYPIVRGIQEAMTAFEHSELNYLVIDDYLVTKKSTYE